ncbi:MAG: endonuclease/exonuclease/phosphatase family protein [Rhodothermales bacterium]|nr:endonuclease/exonuclease/phosphatase family protein [Rhodothermales bacterium]
MRVLDADILLLVEVENLATLEMLIEESLADMGYRPYLVPGVDFFTGQNVGILSRVVIDEVERSDLLARGAADANLQNVSKHIIARFSLSGLQTTLIGVHFLARPSDPGRLVRRQGQAEVIRQIVAQERATGREVIVAGDLNDFDESIRDRNGNRPITDVLRRIKDAGNGPEDDLRNLIAEVPQSERFTALWDRNQNGRAEVTELSAIDHILVSDLLYRKVREVRYVHSHDPLTVTDHFPIVVSFAPRSVDE